MRLANAWRPGSQVEAGPRSTVNNPALARQWFIAGTPSIPVLRVNFVGIRTDRLNETIALLRDVLNIPVTRKADGLVGFRLVDGASSNSMALRRTSMRFSRPGRLSPSASMIFRLCDGR
jgi:hypothetical protein